MYLIQTNLCLILLKKFKNRYFLSIKHSFSKEKTKITHKMDYFKDYVI